MNVSPSLTRLPLYRLLHRTYSRCRLAAHRARLRREYAPFAGEGFTCNACGARYSRFAPHPPAQEANRAALERHAVMAGFGPNALCPSCLCTNRDRLVLAALGRLELSGARVLHMAPEPLVFRLLKARGATVVTADYEPQSYRWIDRGILFADLTALPFPDAHFDGVVANHVLEHIPEDRKAMRELARVLRPGGFALLQVPFSHTLADTIEEPYINDPVRQSALFGQRDHVRIYALRDYLRRLEESGLQPRYQPHEELQDLYRFAIQPGEGILLARKPESVDVPGRALAGGMMSGAERE